MPTQGDTTQLLAAVRQGDRSAKDRLFAQVYQELRLVAHRQLRRRRPGASLETTGLVHEAYLKLVDQTRSGWQDRSHFLAVAAVAMRHILVDYARRRAAQKRGGDEPHLLLDEARVGEEGQLAEVLAVDEVLSALFAVDERLGRLVELRFFGGLTVEETGEVLGISERTVKRDWRKARAFLYRELSARG